MKKTYYFIFAFCSLCLLAFVAGCTRPEKTQRVASNANQVMVYTPFSEEIAKEVAEEFTKKTGIEVILVLEGTTKILSRIRAEKGYPRCDVWCGGGGMIPFMAAAEAGLIQKYIPKGYEEMPASKDGLILRDKDFRWTGVAVIALGLAYNPEVTSKKELPRTWSEIVDPKWKGEIEMWDPSVSGTAMLFLDSMILDSLKRTGKEDEGWKFLTDFWRNMRRYTVEGKPAFSVARGEVKLGVHFGHQVLEFVEEQGVRGDDVTKNIDFYLPEKTPVLTDPIALIKGAPNEDNGKKYIDFVLSAEGQKILNKHFFTVDPSLPSPEGLSQWDQKSLRQHAMELDSDWMAQNYDRIRRQWQNEVESVSKD